MNRPNECFWKLAITIPFLGWAPRLRWSNVAIGKLEESVLLLLVTIELRRTTPGRRWGWRVLRLGESLVIKFPIVHGFIQTLPLWMFIHEYCRNQHGGQHLEINSPSQRETGKVLMVWETPVADVGLNLFHCSYNACMKNYLMAGLLMDGQIIWVRWDEKGGGAGQQRKSRRSSHRPIRNLGHSPLPQHPNSRDAILQFV